MLFLIGAFPPPLHGFSAITSSLYRKIQTLCAVKTFNRAPKYGKRGKRRIVRELICLPFALSKIFVLALVLQPKSLYLGLSGGPGIYVDALYMLCAGASNRRLYIHHHNFTYLDIVHPGVRWLIKIAPRARHIVLCKHMGNLLIRQYGLEESQICCVSNISFAEPAKHLGGIRWPSEISSGFLRIGFLSNITEAKGIFDFFTIINALTEAGVSVDGVIAGPVDAAVEQRFYAELSSTPNVKFRGPVYGPKKDEFFSTIDVLLFPTKYANEAEPLTIAEALSRGIPVIAPDRGCISEMLRCASSYLGPRDPAEFIPFAVKAITEITCSPEQIGSTVSEGLKDFIYNQQVALNSLLFEISEGCASPKSSWHEE